MSAESEGLTGQQCDERCKEFASITGTDTALAMFYLQDRNWNLERSLDAFFESGTGDSAPPIPSVNQSAVSAEGASDTAKNHNHGHDERGMKRSAAVAMPEEGEPDTDNKRIRLMSWNIDGLDEKNLETRTDAVIDTILRESPDIVFLQEVIDQTQTQIRERCSNYAMVSAYDPNAGMVDQYFVCIMMKKSTVKCKKGNIDLIEFPNSVMSRNLLKVKAKVKGVEFTLMTSHLESTKDYRNARVAQLQMAFKEMREAPDDDTVVFGGDLNLRDKEVPDIPDGIVDLWVNTGSRPEAKYTWDMTRNINLPQMQRFKPRLRFDRLYMRPAKQKRAVKPVYFELIGLEKIHKCGRFPSDHWGLMVHFDNLV
ncbi:unnamed protein product [Owenia fusiformis]|uniref:Tyrosyl-DNA phosphodiesterase 2 n=1 Tax=Owenia fusiformis TaxID=6347 RepID=A0A8J1U209_OWEFU|nr:unnamed protein product [Owenia fusiformis]